MNTFWLIKLFWYISNVQILWVNLNSNRRQCSEFNRWSYYQAAVCWQTKSKSIGAI